MSVEERLNRALGARVAPAKDLHFALEVMRRAEAVRFRSEALRRMMGGAGLAALAAVFAVGVAGWAAQNADVAWDAVLAVGGLMATWSLVRGVRARTTAPGR